MQMLILLYGFIEKARPYNGRAFNYSEEIYSPCNPLLSTQAL